MARKRQARIEVGHYKYVNANWSVYWIANGKVQRKRFGHNLAEATRIYGLLVRGERKAVTLHCDNVGFPPPESLTNHRVETSRIVTRTVYVTRKFKKRKRGGGWKVVKREVPKKKRFKKVKVTYVNRMGELNDKGIFWCPYCMKLRRFEMPKEVYSELLDMWLPNKDRALFCPMCQISTKNGHVLRHNPKALQISYHKRTRRGGGSGRRRRRRNP